MAFLHNDDLVNNPTFIRPFDPGRLSCGAYELSLGEEVFMTNDSLKQPKRIQNGSFISILPGQFALLMTEEEVAMPGHLLGFISMKAKIKFRGLINVSGFHVDPGFEGKLKFSVYNAGPNTIILRRGQPTFLIWFSEFKSSFVGLDLYSGKVENFISDDDVDKIKGNVVSANSLKKDVAKLKVKINIISGFTVAMLAVLVTLLVDKLFK